MAQQFLGAELRVRSCRAWGREGDPMESPGTPAPVAAASRAHVLFRDCARPGPFCGARKAEQIIHSASMHEMPQRAREATRLLSSDGMSSRSRLVVRRGPGQGEGSLHEVFSVKPFHGRVSVFPLSSPPSSPMLQPLSLFAV
ncbi:hypothetical protein EXIGLDRAFT_474696 [Exidia glandulosa HHB12029]|uniref:Uncharacterized protein n=1 Tax=Exidia glandulosa HHB12029 TaxID=1314781 RepID=A0A165JWB8_EXIGL|nr:hypothetical protein EXIGLDRAFT_474696 [Exidia glandulosa HHB12029]